MMAIWQGCSRSGNSRRLSGLAKHARGSYAWRSTGKTQNSKKEKERTQVDNEEEALTLWRFAREELWTDERITEVVLSGVKIILYHELAWDSSTLLDIYSVTVEHGEWHKEIKDARDIAAACTYLAGITSTERERAHALREGHLQQH
jgi:hypothetical protein